jgi:hypothetical protein
VKFSRAIRDWRLLVCLVFVGAVSGGIAYAASPGAGVTHRSSDEAVPRCSMPQTIIWWGDGWRCATTSVRFKRVRMSPTVPTFVVASCNPGEVATGGGYDAQGAPLSPMQGRPTFAGGQGDIPSGWAFEGQAKARVRLQVFVICQGATG